MQSTDLDPKVRLKSFVYRLVTINAILAIIGVTSLGLAQHYFLRQFSVKVINGAREELITGDFRAAQRLIIKQSSDVFTRIMIVSDDGKNHLLIHSIEATPIFLIHFNVPVGLSPENPSVIVEFDYSSKGILWFGLLGVITQILITFHVTNLQRRRILATISAEQNFQMEKMFAETARQVAHDIRSPLSVLKSYTKDLPGIPADQSQAIHLSVNRIGDILTDLERGKKAHISSSPHPDTSESLEKLLTILAIEQIVAEKRFQYASRPEVTISTQIKTEISDTISVQKKEFYRILSNLIDNAVQAIEVGNPGDIRVTLASGVITISDTGKGIAPDLLPKLFERGATFGKSDGTGLGLFHAKQTVTRWGGDISISSVLNHGTAITVQLPPVPAPSWLCQELQLQNSDSILVLDDDPSVHQFWDTQLKTKTLFHAYSFRQARDFLKELPDSFLVDYEIRNESMNGYDLIRELGVSQQAVLITSHHNEKSLQEQCRQIGLKILPKPLMGLIKITT